MSSSRLRSGCCSKTPKRKSKCLIFIQLPLLVDESTWWHQLSLNAAPELGHHSLLKVLASSTRHDCSVINPNLQSVLINNQTFKVQNGCYTDNICSSLNSSLYYLPITVWHWQTSAFFWVIFRLNCRVGSTYARFSTWQHKTAGITRVHIPGLQWGQHL